MSSGKTAKDMTKSAKKKVDDITAETKKNRRDRRDKRATDLPKAVEQLSCSAQTSRYSLMAMNLLFLIFGALITAYASIAKSAKSTQLTSEGLSNSLIALGTFVMVLAFFGCCGAWKKLGPLLLCYSILLTVLVLVQVVLAAVVLSDDDQARSLITTGWTDSSSKTKCDLQYNFACCGINAVNDSVVYQSECCTARLDACVNGACLPDLPPCLGKLTDELKKNYATLGGVAIGFAVAEILGVLLALLLRNAMKDELDMSDLQRSRIDDD